MQWRYSQPLAIPRQINAELQRVASSRDSNNAQEKELIESFDQSIQDLVTEEASFDATVQLRKKELEVLPVCL